MTFSPRLKRGSSPLKGNDISAFNLSSPSDSEVSSIYDIIHSEVSSIYDIIHSEVSSICDIIHSEVSSIYDIILCVVRTKESLLQITAREVTGIFTNIQVEGQENIPRNPPFIIASNHMSAIDVPVIEKATGLQIFWMTRVDYSREYFGLLRNFTLFHVTRGAPDMGALDQAVSFLSRGKIVGIMPEGTRGRETGHAHKLKAFKWGIVYVATRADVPIVPIGIEGTESLFRNPRSASFLRRPKVIVKIGKPFNLEARTGKITRDEIKEMSEELDIVRERISELLPERYL